MIQDNLALFVVMEVLSGVVGNDRVFMRALNVVSVGHSKHPVEVEPCGTIRFDGVFQVTFKDVLVNFARSEATI